MSAAALPAKNLAQYVIDVASVAERDIALVTDPRDQGWSRAFVSSAVLPGADIYASVYRMEPNQLHPAHRHPRSGELYYVLEGACDVSIGGHQMCLRPGMAVYTPPRVWHALRTTDVEVKVLAVFPAGDLDDIGMEWVDERPFMT